MVEMMYSNMVGPKFVDPRGWFVTVRPLSVKAGC